MRLNRSEQQQHQQQQQNNTQTLSRAHSHSHFHSAHSSSSGDGADGEAGMRAHPTRFMCWYIVARGNGGRKKKLGKKDFLVIESKSFHFSLFGLFFILFFHLFWRVYLCVCVSVAVACVAAIKLSPKKNDIKQKSSSKRERFMCWEWQAFWWCDTAHTKRAMSIPSARRNLRCIYDGMSQTPDVVIHRVKGNTKHGEREKETERKKKKSADVERWELHAFFLPFSLCGSVSFSDHWSNNRPHRILKWITSIKPKP